MRRGKSSYRGDMGGIAGYLFCAYIILMCKPESVKTYSRDISCLVKPLREAVQRLFLEWDYGGNIVVAQTLRSYRYQEFLYYWGRYTSEALKIAKELGLSDAYIKQLKNSRVGKLTDTLYSKHLFGMAVDLYVVEGGVILQGRSVYLKIYDFLRDFSSCPIRWGGWFRMRDFGHFELDVDGKLRDFFKRAKSGEVIDVAEVEIAFGWA